MIIIVRILFIVNMNFVFIIIILLSLTFVALLSFVTLLILFSLTVVLLIFVIMNALNIICFFKILSFAFLTLFARVIFKITFSFENIFSQSFESLCYRPGIKLAITANMALFDVNHDGKITWTGTNLKKYSNPINPTN